ncbi:hypothetical protein [Gloeothece verrucosa]|uniref:Fluorescence recovery protein n=1 Tax=Gloeothece verrucosa (strain PCC 7822) TaxID=497965 RepID=E0UDW5_GLOV7|nr:hypothetical protein [Gloeothece verrucosa]ADN16550.1 conserved hypothetical protein [Gloeothece verrucosa PCC 7822]
MQQTEIIWSETEQKIAQEAFSKAYQRETSFLINQIRSQATEIVDLDQVWQLHDFLSARRHQIDGKYDYQYSALIFVFAQLVKEGWLHLKDLEGLDQDKLAKIAALTRM